MTAVKVFSWDKEGAVTFDNIHQTILVDPRTWTETQQGAEDAADIISAAAVAVHAGGGLVGLRFWKELEVGDTPYLWAGDWWDTLTAYEVPAVAANTQQLWDWFTARMVVNAEPIDYLIHDLELGDFWHIPSIDRVAYFLSVTIDDENNPYPYTPNPYIGEVIGGSSTDIANQFIQDYRQWNIEQRANLLRGLTDGILPIVAGDQYSNYKDTIEAFTTSDLNGFPLRLPVAQARLADVSAVEIYLDFTITQSLTDPEVEYTTAKELVNRRRWKNMIYSVNSARAAMANASGQLHPWISHPGYGRGGANTHSTSAQLPIEKIIWNHLIRHMMAMGVDTFILWNPDTEFNPEAVDTDTFMDAYFADKVVGVVDRTVTKIADDADSFSTGSFTSNYSEMFEIATWYYRRETINPEAHTRGIGTQADPHIISMGATGDTELADMVTSIEANQDDTPTTQEVDVRSQIIGPIGQDGNITKGTVTAQENVTGSFLFYVIRKATGARVDTDITVTLTAQRSAEAEPVSAFTEISVVEGDLIGIETISASPDVNMSAFATITPTLPA